ncbi:hypothetical protein KGF56_004728 [Candida oxycetoniae]|uniref:Uncharacterized protein n=1 Tax=Candida oxycetoniae TaxID=497107 RepID=A0AAI9STQ8_9ASCO|nr:uncharacterized protein KGF56_004728 [Candida oxycetoniae]KAI3402487.2 hypothetical protein KGF56_004728 [Candida oxycetoniae]
MSSLEREKEPLPGNILKLNLLVEDEATSETIASSNIWLHVSKADYEPSSDPTFINMSLVAIWSLGYYHIKVTREVFNTIFKQESISKIEPGDAYEIFTNLFPLDLDGLVESKEKDGRHQNLFLSAKIKASKSDYNAEGVPVTDRIDNDLTILIKSNTKFSPTVGLFTMKAIDFEDYEYLEDERDLLNWMALYSAQNEKLLNSLVKCKASLNQVQEANLLLEDGLQIAKRDNQDIVFDLESKFYQVLNAKKDVIYELTKGSRPSDELIGLNQGFVGGVRKLRNIDMGALPVKEGEAEKRVKKEKPVGSKRRKTGKVKVEEMEEMEKVEEEKQSQKSETTLEEENKLPRVKIKKETESPLKSLSAEDKPFPKIKDEPYSKIKDEPFPKIKDEPFPKIKDEPFPKIKDEPFPKIKDEPYSKIKDESAFSKIKVKNEPDVVPKENKQDLENKTKLISHAEPIFNREDLKFSQNAIAANSSTDEELEAENEVKTEGETTEYSSDDD